MGFILSYVVKVTLIDNFISLKVLGCCAVPTTPCS